ncbi:MAG: hypothetical protein ABL933_03905 [Methyloglobulus sp.]|nr:hypothetical protein [Methyloglobulus sp.]
MNLKPYGFAQQTAMPIYHHSINAHPKNSLENTDNNQRCPLRSWRIA